MPLSKEENLARAVEVACRTAAAAIRSGKRRSEDDIKALLACLATFNSRRGRYYEGSLALVDTRRIPAAIKRVNSRLILEVLGEISVRAPVVPSNTGSKEALGLPLGELDFSVRVCNCMKNEEFYNVRELVRKRPEDLLAMRNFGKTCLSEVERILAGYGLRLGMTEEEIRRIEEDTTSLEMMTQEGVEHFLGERITQFCLPLNVSRAAGLCGAETVRDLVKLTADDLMSKSGFGPASLRKVRDFLAGYDLRFGMTDEEIAALLARSRK